MKREINDYTLEFLEDTENDYKEEKYSETKDRSLQYDESFLEEIDLTLRDFIMTVKKDDWIIIEQQDERFVLVKNLFTSSDHRLQILELKSKNFIQFLNGQKRFGRTFIDRKLKSFKRSKILDEIVEVNELKLVNK